MRSVFLAGCVTLALPGLAASGSHAVQAWTAWQSAQAAAHGAQAVGEAMRASTLLMAERGQLQAAAFEAAPEAGALAQAAASDLALERTLFALVKAGLPVAAVERAREGVAVARGRATDAARKRSGLRTPLEQFARTIETLDEEASRAERAITLASPSVGVVVGLARTAGELRGIAGRRGLLLNSWLGGRELTSAQKDELLVLTGRLAGAWDRLQRGVRAAGPTPALLDTVASTDARFFGEEEPWYRELAKTAAVGAERPLTHAQYRHWSVPTLEALLPVRDALVAEAAAQGKAAASAARRSLLAGAGITAVSLGLVVAAVLTLLRGLVEPVRGMTAAMTALAAGNLAAKAPARGRLREMGAMAEAVTVFRDNLARLHRREAELCRTNLLFAAAIENMSQGLAMYDADERLAVFNRRFCEITGLPPERVRPGMAYQEVIALAVGAGHYPGRSAEQAYAERRDRIAGLEVGDCHDELTGGRAVAVRNGPMAGGGWVSTFEDVTERHATEARIVHMAHHDALTGLPNRVLFHEHLQRVLARVRRDGDRGGQFAVLCLDLDGFKSVNDTLGHPVGDELLRQVAHRLRETARETDLVARLGGDEFAVVRAEAQRPAEAAALAERLVAALRAPFDLEGQRVEIGVSIGVVLADEASAAADELLRNADIALYRAKAAGRGTWRFFEPGMDAEIQRRRVLETDLKHALAEGQFELHYQPLVAAGTRAPTGFEALLRWRHPERGLVPPAEFIPLAEETGLIRAIGTWVLTRACADAALWPGHVKVAVNLSPAQFAKGRLVRQVERALTASGLAPRRLELEITESVLLQDSDATLGTLHRLRALGVSISMDDFGTGYSSLSYLRRFPFDKIKLDQSFVRDLDRERGSLEIVRAVVGLGKALGMAVLAEGVETEEQLGILRGEGCDELQGYLFSRPLPARDVPAIIAGHSAAKGGSAPGPMLVVDNAADGQGAFHRTATKALLPG